jgi:hypothetical protein
MIAAPSIALATVKPVFTESERLALARFPGRLPWPDP